MRVIGLVTRKELLEAQDGKKPLYSISIEGLGFLARPEVAAACPETGEVELLGSVQWREKGARPLFWAQHIKAL